MHLLASPSKAKGLRLVRRRSLEFGQAINQSVTLRLFHQSRVRRLLYLGILFGLNTIISTYLGSEVGALLTFPPAPGGGKTTILARVGVSLISRTQACSNANSEIPDFNFEGVRSANKAQWNELLSRVQVDTTGVPTQTVQLFYSSVGVLSFDQKCFIEVVSLAVSDTYISS